MESCCLAALPALLPAAVAVVMQPIAVAEDSQVALGAAVATAEAEPW